MGRGGEGHGVGNGSLVERGVEWGWIGVERFEVGMNRGGEGMEWTEIGHMSDHKLGHRTNPVLIRLP